MMAVVLASSRSVELKARASEWPRQHNLAPAGCPPRSPRPLGQAPRKQKDNSHRFLAQWWANCAGVAVLWQTRRRHFSLLLVLCLVVPVPVLAGKERATTSPMRTRVDNVAVVAVRVAPGRLPARGGSVACSVG